MPTQKNSASWDLQLAFNSAFKRLTVESIKPTERHHLPFTLTQRMSKLWVTMNRVCACMPRKFRGTQNSADKDSRILGYNVM